jgi:hypothetical protein
MPILRADRFVSNGGFREQGTPGRGAARLALTRTRADPTPRKKWSGSSSSTGSAPDTLQYGSAKGRFAFPFVSPRPRNEVPSCHGAVDTSRRVEPLANDFRPGAMKCTAAGPPVAAFRRVRLARADLRLCDERSPFGFEEHHLAHHSRAGLIVFQHRGMAILPALPRLSPPLGDERSLFGSDGR